MDIYAARVPNAYAQPHLLCWAVGTYVRYDPTVDMSFERHDLERLRRSIVSGRIAGSLAALRGPVQDERLAVPAESLERGTPQPGVGAQPLRERPPLAPNRRAAV